jgi:hypothetical protein
MQSIGAAETIRLANLAAHFAQELARERANNRLLLSILAGRPIQSQAAHTFGSERKSATRRSAPNAD